jgi:hypothetical protein
MIHSNATHVKRSAIVMHNLKTAKIERIATCVNHHVSVLNIDSVLTEHDTNQDAYHAVLDAFNADDSEVIDCFFASANQDCIIEIIQYGDCFLSVYTKFNDALIILGDVDGHKLDRADKVLITKFDTKQSAFFATTQLLQTLYL